MLKIGDESVEKISKISSGIVALVALVVLTVLSFGFVMNLDKKAYGASVSVSCSFPTDPKFPYLTTGDYSDINIEVSIWSGSSFIAGNVIKSTASSTTFNNVSGEYSLFIKMPTFVQYVVVIGASTYSSVGLFNINLSNTTSILIVVTGISQETWFNNSTTI